MFIHKRIFLYLLTSGENDIFLLLFDKYFFHIFAVKATDLACAGFNRENLNFRNIVICGESHMYNS